MRPQAVGLDAPASPLVPSVLLVDDHPDLVALEAALQPLELRVVRARSGAEALERLQNEELAAVLLDAPMPGLNQLGARTSAFRNVVEPQRCPDPGHGFVDLEPVERSCRRHVEIVVR